MNGFSKIFFSCLTFAIVSNFVQGQNVTSSPYSRYGIGELQDAGYSQNFSMGGLGAAMQNDTLTPHFINFNNPASLPFNRITTFELGFASSTFQAFNKTEKQITNTVTLSHVAFALPIYKWWGTGFGLKPFSGIGYNITDTKDIDSIGTVKYTYKGAGGINQIYWGNGFKIKRLSIGINASYLTGRLENTSYIVMPSSNYYTSTRTYKTTAVRSFYFDYGAQYCHPIDSVWDKNVIDSVKIKHIADSIKYRFSSSEEWRKHALDSLDKISYKFKKNIYRKLKEPIRIIVGGKISTATDLNTTTGLLAQSYIPDPYGGAYFKDTLENTSGVKGTIHLPIMYTAGITFKKGDRIVIGAEYAVQQWADYKTGAVSGGLKNSSTYKLGFQLLPAPKNQLNAHYLKRIFYRAGIRYTDSYLRLQGTDIKEYAASIGFGFPVGRTKHQWVFQMFNVGFEVGQRGTTNNDLIKENFFKILLGVTINDRWFIKPKFD